nr:MAG TPA: hypothetical protein [Caudoviricetes sp.]
MLQFFFYHSFTSHLLYTYLRAIARHVYMI